LSSSISDGKIKPEKEKKVLLAIDIGNSNIVFGVHNRQKWIEKWRMHTDKKKMPDEYGVFFEQLLKQEGVSLSDIKSTVVSSVVPQLTGRIKRMIEKLTASESIIIGPGVKTGLVIRTDNPAEVGADLVANAVAAWKKYKKNCIIVDFGTALSYSAVSSKGEFLGAVISPGIFAAAEALSEHTAQLPKIWLKKPDKTIGKNTVTSMQSGIVNGYIGSAEYIISKMKEELGSCEVIATGGSADIITPFTKVFTHLEPWLTLEGLRYIADLNFPGKPGESKC
jgi:type III pantothenate kinase